MSQRGWAKQNRSATQGTPPRAERAQTADRRSLANEVKTGNETGYKGKFEQVLQVQVKYFSCLDFEF